jgi:dipeptidyl aminopeptidase/acylaminoacyl peptidase
LKAVHGVDVTWIVYRQSAIDPPNYYFTKDFKKFTALTNIHPQMDYNWLKTELVTWKMFDGKKSQGILYKPEDFDPNKKYPIIFNYYEQLSHRLYEFPNPGFTYANINIPWYVSRGYLVFTPDIHFTIAASRNGRTTGESAFNAVISAAKYLSRFSFVDKKRMAIQGHSFGGGVTNYLITHSTIFAAAAEMAGDSDPISGYLTLIGKNGSDESDKQGSRELGQGRMGASLWQRSDLYLRNSVVLNADKITSPLLIVHNQKDAAISWRQGLELYMALRRLGKSCWMLQYDNESHTLLEKVNKVDYTIRLTQFFDHYLKGMPAPKWMTRTNLALYKDNDNLYDFDFGGNCGEKCKICQAINKKK